LGEEESLSSGWLTTSWVRDGVAAPRQVFNPVFAQEASLELVAWAAANLFSGILTSVTFFWTGELIALIGADYGNPQPDSAQAGIA